MLRHLLMQSNIYKKKKLMESTLSKIEAIKASLSLYYDIRFNVATGKIEVKDRNSNDPFLVADNEKIRQLQAVLKENGLKCTKSEIYKAFNEHSFNREKSTELMEIEMFLDTMLEKRYNIIKRQPEIKKEGSEAWESLNKYKVNSLVRLLDTNGIKCSAQRLNDLFNSDYCEAVNPVKEYFLDLGEHKLAEEGSYIDQLADTVTIKIGADRWNEYFRRWLVGCVSNVFNDDRCTNQVMLVITGQQGAYKTTWLENLCPKELKDLYMFSGKLDPTSKDVDTLISECFLINIDDQLRQLNRKDEEELKNMITKNRVKYRRPYDIYIEEYPHLASFCGSVNGNEFLTDTTGSRRYLPFEAEAIDINAAQAIDMDNVWREAYYLFKHGYKYWFSRDEVDKITADNGDFAVVSMEEQFLIKYFRPAKPGEPAAEEWQPGEILAFLQGQTGYKNLTPKKIGEALAKLGFQKRRASKSGLRTNVYDVIKLDNMIPS